jgi:hypothetical protein
VPLNRLAERSGSMPAANAIMEKRGTRKNAIRTGLPEDSSVIMPPARQVRYRAAASM